MANAHCIQFLIKQIKRGMGTKALIHKLSHFVAIHNL